jgi:hypothetical protein
MVENWLDILNEKLDVMVMVYQLTNIYSKFGIAT